MTLTEIFGLVAILDPLYVGFTDECRRLQIRVTGCKNIRCFFSAEPTALEHWRKLKALTITSDLTSSFLQGSSKHWSTTSDLTSSFLQGNSKHWSTTSDLTSSFLQGNSRHWPQPVTWPHPFFKETQNTDPQPVISPHPFFINHWLLKKLPLLGRLAPADWRQYPRMQLNSLIVNDNETLWMLTISDWFMSQLNNLRIHLACTGSGAVTLPGAFVDFGTILLTYLLSYVFASLLIYFFQNWLVMVTCLIDGMQRIFIRDITCRWHPPICQELL